MAGSSSGRDAAVWVDNKDGAVHWNGDPAFGEEWEERAWLSFHTTATPEQQKLFPLKLLNNLSDRAWRLTHKRPELQVQQLLAAKDPKTATELVLTLVRAACEKVAPLRKREAFDNFFRKGGRKPQESIQDYISRREADYERLTTLSSTTRLSEDLRTYFLLDLSLINEETHKRILGMCGNSYEWDKITEAMMIQLDRPDGARERESGGAPHRGRFAGRRWNTGAYEAEPVEQQWYDWECSKGYDQ